MLKPSLLKNQQDKGKKCIFIGYNKISKTYKSFDLVDKKILLVGMFVMNLQMQRCYEQTCSITNKHPIQIG
jgi:hypothetical protein